MIFLPPSTNQQSRAKPITIRQMHRKRISPHPLLPQPNDGSQMQEMPGKRFKALFHYWVGRGSVGHTERARSIFLNSVFQGFCFCHFLPRHTWITFHWLIHT